MGAYCHNYIAILGPTASGKSSLAMELARLFDGEIVACDSVQVYRGFDVGSAKPTKEDQREVVHHLLDCVDCTATFDASCYSKTARTVVLDIIKRGKLPIIVVGTGLYFRALQHENFHNLPNDLSLRKELKTLSSQEIYDKLLVKDPARAEQIHINDHFRLARSLEIVTLSGKTFVELTDQQVDIDDAFKAFLTISISPTRSELHSLIAKRAKQMLADGFVEEVKSLIRLGCRIESKSMQAIGYKQVCDFLQGKIPQTELLDRIIFATRQYAKRQCTLLKKTPCDIKLSNHKDIIQYIPEIKKNLNSL